MTKTKECFLDMDDVNLQELWVHFGDIHKIKLEEVKG